MVHPWRTRHENVCMGRYNQQIGVHRSTHAGEQLRLYSIHKCTYIFYRVLMPRSMEAQSFTTRSYYPTHKILLTNKNGAHEWEMIDHAIVVKKNPKRSSKSIIILMATLMTEHCFHTRIARTHTHTHTGKLLTMQLLCATHTRTHTHTHTHTLLHTSLPHAHIEA